MPICGYAHERIMSRFDDRTVTLDAPEQLADLGLVFSARTRLAVLGVLVRADRPLNINEVGRRVGVDASPVRGHLELLVKEGLAREMPTTSGRERLFETSLKNVTVTLEGYHAHKVAVAGKPPKAVVRLQRKLDAMRKDMSRLEEKARRVQEEINEAWKSESPTPA